MARIPMNFQEVPSLEELKKAASPGNYNVEAQSAGLSINPEGVVLSEVRWIIIDPGEFEGKAVPTRYYLGEAVLDEQGALVEIKRGQSDWGAALLKDAFDACGVKIDVDRGPDTDDLLGKTCNALVSIAKTETGRDFNRIEAYLPVA